MQAMVEENTPFRANPAGWQALFTAIDRRDATAFASFLTTDAEFRFGNGPAIQGRAAIIQAVAAFFGMLAACRHRMIRSWLDGSSTVCEGEVTYVLADGSKITVPFVNVFDLAETGISSYRIYIDNGPLFAALG